jgi:uncharacterized protein YjbI with pentapeptide repeats
MKTIKPQKLGILTRSFEFKGRFRFGLSVLMYAPLGSEMSLYSEVGMWKFAAEELGKDAALDAGIPKARAEFLVTGFAFTPHGEARTGCPVRARLGGCEKTLHVYGDRYWKGSFPTEPAPFTSIPLDWPHAYGGEGYDRNPIGKGFKPVSADDVISHPLPNILHSLQRITSSDQRLEPAGFGPIDFAWPQRFTKAGTYDERWLKEDFPGFAPDIDWTIFNVASSDQWLDTTLQGDEPYLLENMHPSMPHLEGRLPGILARCFINRKKEEGESFDEIPMRLSTVWFFPHARRMILISQGSCEVTDQDAADISQLIIAAEAQGESKPVEHYRKVLVDRLDKEKGSLYALRDSDLLPSGLDTPDASMLEDKAMLEGEDLIRKRMRARFERETERARAIVAGYGLDPDLHGPKMPPPEEPVPAMEDLPEYIDKVFAEAEARKAASEKEAAKSLEDTEKLLTSLGIDFNNVRKEITEKPKGPPTFKAQDQIDALKQLGVRLRQQGIETTEIDSFTNDEAFCNRLFEGERKLKEAYRLTAHFQDAPSLMQEQVCLSTRDAVQAAHARGEGFAGVDLTGVDLSGMDLNGASFTGAFLESSDLTGANLTGCDLRQAVLAHANLEGTRLTDANLEGANLGAARLTNARLVNANLTDAILAKADLTGAVFKGARLHGADCSEAVFKDTDFSEIEAAQLNFLDSDLRGLLLAGARMEKCNFLKADVSGVDFSAGSLKGSVFLESKGTGARFRGTDLTNVRFVQKCAFGESIFAGAFLNKANLRGSDLHGCDFTEARLDSSDLSECDLRKANFYRAVAKEARFDKADLSGAVMTSINAMNASLQRANICGTDLRGANLFQVDLARVQADGATDLTNALTKKVRVYPRRAK